MTDTKQQLKALLDTVATDTCTGRRGDERLVCNLTIGELKDLLVQAADIGLIVGLVIGAAEFRRDR